jgi:8-hydroxy-5-deazaflavin:NADPH oxidoreductase
MSCAIIGFGKIGHALGKAFPRKGIEVSVATTHDPKSFAADAAPIGPTIIPKTLGEAAKADTIFWLSISSRTRMSLRRCPPDVPPAATRRDPVRRDGGNPYEHR